MNFLAKSAWEEDEQVECIGADVFLRRLVINLHPTNLAIIAPGAHVFFWEGGEIGSSCSLDCAVFWLFRDTNIDITTGGAVRVDCVEEPGPFERSAPPLRRMFDSRPPQAWCALLASRVRMRQLKVRMHPRSSSFQLFAPHDRLRRGRQGMCGVLVTVHS